MMNILLYTVGISFFIQTTTQSPHIFREKITCDVFTQLKKKTKHYVLPARIIAENEDLRVIVSLCTKDPYVPGGQTTKSKVFIYDKTSALNSSDIHPYEVFEDQVDIKISISTNIKCTNERYTVTVKFGRENLKKPRLDVDQCEIEITIPTPDPAFHFQCKKYIDGKWFIDLTPLKRRTFSVSNDKGEVFNVSLCESAVGCNRQAGCKIAGNETTVIGLLKTQTVQYDEKTNTVRVYSSITEGRNKRTMSVHLRCNWNVPLLANPKLINEGSNFKFEVQSSLGCVKIPKSCIIKDENRHVTYDLHKLSNKYGSLVANTSAPIRLNICGDLHIRGNSQCNTENSQVCEIRQKLHLNRGSIPNFEVTGENLRASFRDGHQCNTDETYSTIVDLKCSSTDKGPILVSDEGCLTSILWETPEACPKVQIEAKSCEFHSPYGAVDLNGLRGNNSFTASFPTNKKLVYNICDKLNFTCSSSDQVSACLTDGNRQRIIGWNEPNLSYINGKLQLKYTGEKCQGRNQPYSLTIDLKCSFEEKQAEPVLLQVDSCAYEAKISSPSACLKPWDKRSCLLEGENFRYDLSPLTRKDDRNYEIEDVKNRNITYFVNLCAPLLSKENLLFHSNSMMSKRNSSEILVTQKFTSLGQVTSPIIKDGEVFVKLIGGMCEPGVVYSSKINFECSNVEEGPKILNINGCSLEFMWRTRYACPIMKQGGKCSLTDGNSSTQVPGNPLEIKMDDFNTFHFSLCLEHYRWCTRDGSCFTKKILSKRIQVNNDIFYVQLTLDNADGSILRTANLMIECDPYTLLSSTKGQSRSPDHLELYVKTRISCNKALRKANRAAESNTQNKEPVNENGPVYQIIDKIDDLVEPKIAVSDQNITKEDPHQTETKVNQPSASIKTPTEQTPEVLTDAKLSYTIKNDTEVEKTKPTDDIRSISNRKCEINVGGKKLNMNDLTSKEFKSPDATYILNFDGNSNKCGGLICKNGGNLLDFVEDCPEVSHGEDYVYLKYLNIASSEYVYAANSSLSIIGKMVEVSLKCNHAEVSANATETDSTIAFYYSSPKLCDVLESSNILLLVSVIVGVLIFLFLGFILCYVLYKKNYFKRLSYDSVSQQTSLINHSKML